MKRDFHMSSHSGNTPMKRSDPPRPKEEEGEDAGAAGNHRNSNSNSNGNRGDPSRNPSGPSSFSSSSSPQQNWDVVKRAVQKGHFHRRHKNVYQPLITGVVQNVMQQHHQRRQSSVKFAVNSTAEKLSILTALSKHFVFRDLISSVTLKQYRQKQQHQQQEQHDDTNAMDITTDDDNVDKGQVPPEGDDIDVLIDAFEIVQYHANDIIIHEGYDGIDQYFYIVKSGIVKFQVNGIDVDNGSGCDPMAHAGDCFGELSLLYTCPRAATAIAVTEPTVLYRVHHDLFRYLLKQQMEYRQQEKKRLIQGVPFLQQNLINPNDLEKLCSVMTPRVFAKDEILCHKGQPGDAFYIIQRGRVVIKDISVGSSAYEDQTLGAGDYFGERSLATCDPHVANIVALSDGVAFRIDRDTFDKHLGRMSDLVLRAIDARKLSGVTVLRNIHLSAPQVAALASHMADIPYRAGECIMKQGETTEAAIYFVRKGKVGVATLQGPDGNHVPIVIAKGGYFGEQNYQQGAISVQSMCTATAIEDCVCGVLKLADSISVFDIGLLGTGGGDVESESESDLDDEDAKVVKKTHPLKQSISEMHIRPMTTTKSGLKDLQRVKILGEGTYGQVWLVVDHHVSKNPKKNKTSSRPRPYALKIQSKYQLDQEHQITAVLQEKQIMEQLRHPFILNLVKTYQDEDFVYMLLELVQGGELFSVLHKQGTGEAETGLPESQSKFYSLCVADALAYMHRSKILYRDLKLENVMIDEDGYPVLIDFGFAKYVEDKTYTFCGTPRCLPPEVILTRGHNASADHWCLGIMIYELVTGINPFYKEGMDHMKLFQAIITQDFDDPKGVSKECIDLIRGLIVKDPKSRIGSLAGGEKDIINHPWFSDLDLKALYRREIAAPWIPTIKDPLDTSHFEDWDHTEGRTSLKRGPISEKAAELFQKF